MDAHPYSGLSDKEVIESRLKNGSNHLESETDHLLLHVLKEILSEPIFILLVITAAVYFILGETQEAVIMLIALAIVSGISVFQERRSRNAVAALKQLTAPRTKVIRNGNPIVINSDEIVCNDIILVEDGAIVPADAQILESHDLSVNESILTGESLAVYKSIADKDPIIYQGTLVASGSCIALVTAVGQQTALGKIGKQLASISTEKTPLQLQIRQFIRRMVIAGIIAFLIVCVINYFESRNVIHSLLHGLTLAMSILPEEIPVAFSTFMALGAYRLYKKQVIAKSPYTVETLGAATVICTDKTGTITENKMALVAIYETESGQLHNYITEPIIHNSVLEYAMWASEPEPFDHMEKSIHAAYATSVASDLRKQFKMVHEYPLDGNPPVMTHCFFDGSDYKIGCKGGLETILKMCVLDPATYNKVEHQAQALSHQGYRVLGVAKAVMPESGFPPNQTGFVFQLLGLIAFYDPPKQNARDIIQAFYTAGISVKMITGDYPATALAIGKQIGMQHDGRVLTGNDILQMDDATLKQSVGNTDIFARMFPDAKLRIVEALKSNGEIVAMTGDGVNDAPALKSAHIGIAMGRKGTETAKNAASLILSDDDLLNMVDAVAIGRRIYENLKKAIRYIISIHVPIILIVTLPLLFFWPYSEMFNPIHVIFLELIMGPTCSIVFENEPIEKGSMQRKPRTLSTAFFSWNELYLSIIQGLVITTGCLGLGYIAMQAGYTIEETRTLVFATLVFSNVFLTLTNRSFYFSILNTIRYKNNLVPIILFLSLVILGCTIYIPAIAGLFGFVQLSALQLLICCSIALVSVLWIEAYKFILRKRSA